MDAAQPETDIEDGCRSAIVSRPFYWKKRSSLWTCARQRARNRLALRNQSVPASRTRTIRWTGIPGASRGARARAARAQADPAVDRLCGLPLVPRHGARVLRGPRHRGAHERAVRQHQGRSRGASRPGSAVPARAADAHRSRRRLAADDVSDARRAAAVLRWHLLSAARRVSACPPFATCCVRWPAITRSTSMSCARNAAQVVAALGDLNPPTAESAPA